ncbi:hypothetical protein SETIT_9G416800v2 [Setaria italica]|uniref:Uncharacterized protein n=1 Tax=Setaria italica TaxID=4555 RepID=K4AL42_SETIT|nr:hypothetical protein SETIT_9G416800v2 [Setaria italica]
MIFWLSLLITISNCGMQGTIEYTGDGSVCIFGHPASKTHRGNWKSCSLNLGNYLTKVLHETNGVAARNVSTWRGTSYLAPLVGAFLADSYLGKYWVTLISQSLFLLCYGALNPCITSFGADQFDHTNEEERNRKSSFFSWHYFALSAGSCGFTPSDFSLLYELPEQGLSIEGSKKLKHTAGLKFFDKAAVVVSSDCDSVGLLESWIMFLEQMSSTFIEQGMVMDKHIGSFEIPAASFQSVDIRSVLVLVPVHERILPVGSYSLWHISLMFMFYLHHMITFETWLSWCLFRVTLINELEDLATYRLRNLMFPLSISDQIDWHVLHLRGNREWIPDNLNEAHLDRFYWVMAGLSFLILVAFMFCAIRYKNKRAS